MLNQQLEEKENDVYITYLIFLIQLEKVQLELDQRVSTIQTLSEQLLSINNQYDDLKNEKEKIYNQLSQAVENNTKLVNQIQEMKSKNYHSSNLTVELQEAQEKVFLYFIVYRLMDYQQKDKNQHKEMVYQNNRIEQLRNN